MDYTIFLIGTGATGSNLIGNLAQYAISTKNIKNIILVDGDIVEVKNYKNQKFTENDLGKNKAKVLANRYSKLGINISYMDSYIEDSNSLIDLINNLETLPIIISCIDNNNGRIILDQVFRGIDNIIYIDTGNGDETSRNGQTVIGAKQDGKIIAPPVVDYFPQILEGDKKEVKNFSCSVEIVEKPQCLSTNVLSATTVFLIIVNLITYNEINGRYFDFDAVSININKIR